MYVMKRVIIMKSIKYIKTFFLVTALTGVLTATSFCFNGSFAQTAIQTKPVQTQTVEQIIRVEPLTVVNSPKSYLNKNIVMNAKFDKFSTLGLDYKPAFKSSEEYISFLIKRDDTSYSIPLSEMKLFLKRDVAEKYIDLKTNDKIQIKGTVFSDVLGDTWIEVYELKILEKAPD